MAISYNTGATAAADTAASVNITIPSGVLVNDVMIMSLEVFTEDASAPSVSFSGAGGSWTLIPTTDSSANPQLSSGSSVYAYGYAYYRVATSGDPGATLTITETGSSSGSTWFAVAMASYTGANTPAPVDVAGSAETLGGADIFSITCPSETTGVNGDWAVYLCPGAPNAGTTTTGPGTRRETIVSGAGIASTINDSDGSAGSSGTVIGGSAFTITGTSNSTWLTAFTIGLAPGAAAPSPSVPVYTASMATM